MSRPRFAHTYEDIISVENLLDAWSEFVKGKRNRADALAFEQRLMANIFSLHERLATRTYRHSGYEAFSVSDPKPRNIHKASVSDRVLHRAIYRKLYPSFDRIFIADSFSCRVGKGTHRALDRFRAMAWQVSCNHTKTCWVLKCDIRKFFASIDHAVLLRLLTTRISDKDILWLLGQVIGSFSSGVPGVGLPLGNLTSQLFANVIMDPFDQFAKHRLKARHFVRYADDFVFLSDDRDQLVEILPHIRDFLSQELCLTLHPDKVFLKTLASGVDFLGWVHFPDHRVLRTATKRRMSRRLSVHAKEEALQSYLGLLSHGNTQNITRRLAQGDQKSV